MKSKNSLLTLNEQKALDIKLKTWGALTRLESSGSAASSLSNNALQSFAKLGIKISNNQKGLQWLSEVEHLDYLINVLHKEKPKWAKAVKLHYTVQGDIRKQAETQSLPKSTYFEQFQHGRDWLGQEFYRLH